MRAKDVLGKSGEQAAAEYLPGAGGPETVKRVELIRSRTGRDKVSGRARAVHGDGCLRRGQV